MRHEEIEEHLLSEVQRTQSEYQLARARVHIHDYRIPSGLPQPDATQRIHNMSRLHASREAFQTALNRFNDFILRGKIPDDLKPPPA